MSLYLVCFMVVGFHSNHQTPRITSTQCEVFQADRLDNKTLDAILAQAAEMYDACETPLVSTKLIRRNKLLTADLEALS